MVFDAPPSDVQKQHNLNMTRGKYRSMNGFSFLTKGLHNEHSHSLQKGRAAQNSKTNQPHS